MVKRTSNRAYYFRGDKYSSRASMESAKKAYYNKQDAIRTQMKAERKAKQEMIARERAERESRQSIQTGASLATNRSIFLYLIAILLVASLVANLTGNGEVRTFAGLLEFLSGAWHIDIDWVANIQPDWGDWGIFDFLQNWLQGIWSGISGVLFLGTCITNTLLLFLSFIRWWFVGF